MADFPNEFVKAVFDTDAKLFFQLLEDGLFSPQSVVDIGFTEHAAMPLHHITICWDIILSKYDEWKEYKEHCLKYANLLLMRNRSVCDWINSWCRNYRLFHAAKFSVSAFHATAKT